MPQLTFPDGAKRQFDEPLDGESLARALSPSLAKKAIALKLEGEVVDLRTPITKDASVEILTQQSEEALDIIRHDAAHVMAEAVQELYPGTQVTIGPVIENGFYYDFARDEPFRPDDLEKIEKRMGEIVDRDETITREVWEREEAVRFFREKGELYKAEIIASIPKSDPITIYRQGDWQDLCRGPHLPSTGKLGKAFKLMRIAGAYWRGDSKNPMLQRIYGTCWADQKSLKRYLLMLEEAAKRDHRKLGRQMQLFHLEETAPGGIFWHPKGWTLMRILSDFLRDKQERGGYQEINTPDLLDRSLWEKSGHWEKFAEHMYVSQTPDDRLFALKPMNCPGHVQIFNQGMKSYRDLPLRFSEFGKVHRYEPSGALMGLLRVRHLTQDDAHIFCRREQITSECVAVTKLILEIYSHFGFHDVHVKLADRPPQRIGSDAIWDEAEKALEDAANAANLQSTRNPGEGAFYGPKLEFILRDAIGRDWQCGTVQLDFNLPERLGASYIDEKGEKEIPVLIHRALSGSLERFVALLIENYAGRLPLWLAPLQGVIAPITNGQDSYADHVFQQFRKSGLRAEKDTRNEKISYKVREHALAKVPFLIAVGQREEEEGSVTLRALGEGKGVQETLPLDKAIARLQKDATPPQ